MSGRHSPTDGAARNGPQEQAPQRTKGKATASDILGTSAQRALVLSRLSSDCDAARSRRALVASRDGFGR